MTLNSVRPSKESRGQFTDFDNSFIFASMFISIFDVFLIDCHKLMRCHLLVLVISLVRVRDILLLWKYHYGNISRSITYCVHICLYIDSFLSENKILEDIGFCHLLTVLFTVHKEHYVLHKCMLNEKDEELQF